MPLMTWHLHVRRRPFLNVSSYIVLNNPTFSVVAYPNSFDKRDHSCSVILDSFELW
ncbi:hypothetical protein HanIR_Chr14g0687661 [Helianthus annuus]|nr:hypothetical protein HanIR_Chr14g0687661 [Helianthus annuus]